MRSLTLIFAVLIIVYCSWQAVASSDQNQQQQVSYYFSRSDQEDFNFLETLKNHLKVEDINSLIESSIEDGHYDEPISSPVLPRHSISSQRQAIYGNCTCQSIDYLSLFNSDAMTSSLVNVVSYSNCQSDLSATCFLQNCPCPSTDYLNQISFTSYSATSSNDVANGIDYSTRFLTASTSSVCTATCSLKVTSSCGETCTATGTVLSATYFTTATSVQIFTDPSFDYYDTVNYDYPYQGSQCFTFASTYYTNQLVSTL